MTKKYLFIISFLAFSFQVKASYSAYEIYEMIIKADKIVLGKIISQDSTTFTFRIKESPTLDSGDIVIEKFSDWACAARWNDYKVDQELLIFLSNYKGKFVAMSGGNEGELPVRNDSIFIHGFSVPTKPPMGMKNRLNIPSFNSKHFLIDDKQYYGYPLSKNDMFESIAIIKSCFNYSTLRYGKHLDWVISCSNKEIKKIASKYKIVKWTYEVAKAES
jgi:hypothetical protein